MSTYKPHYACFECRKTFKRKLLKDVNRDEKGSIAAKCPDCGFIMADMGLDFKAPGKQDIKAWQHLKNLFTVGITFHSCGCSGPGYVPRTTEELVALLQTRQEEFVKQLRFWIHRPEPTTKQELEKDNRDIYSYKWQLPNELKGKKGIVNNKEAITYWTGKIKEVEMRIEKMTPANT